jgi:hypothetical protein
MLTQRFLLLRQVRALLMAAGLTDVEADEVLEKARSLDQEDLQMRMLENIRDEVAKAKPGIAASALISFITGVASGMAVNELKTLTGKKTQPSQHQRTLRYLANDRDISRARRRWLSRKLPADRFDLVITVVKAAASLGDIPAILTSLGYSIHGIGPWRVSLERANVVGYEVLPSGDTDYLRITQVD